MTSSAPDNLTVRIFERLYPGHMVLNLGTAYLVVPKDSPVFMGDSLGEIARAISEQDDPHAEMADIITDAVEPLPRRNHR